MINSVVLVRAAINLMDRLMRLNIKVCRAAKLYQTRILFRQNLPRSVESASSFVKDRALVNKYFRQARSVGGLSVKTVVLYSLFFR